MNFINSNQKVSERLLHKPFVISATEAHEKKIISYNESGAALIDFGEDNPKIVPPKNQYDLTQATIFGLNERLTMSATSPVIADGRTLRDDFNKEWERYEELLEAAEGLKFDYGVYAYYWERNELVRFAPAFWHRVVAVASGSKLLVDPEEKMTWKEIRGVFENTTVAVAGCSVGSNVIHSVVMDLRPKQIKIADKSVYKMENINRVRLGYGGMVKSMDKKKDLMDLGLMNKAETVARQIYSIDPFIDVFVYPDGVSGDNVGNFFDGNDLEPTADIIVEEVDDPRIKLFIREEARKRRIPVIMVSDLASSVQLDILRYDLDSNLSLTYGTSDEKLTQAMEDVYDKGGDREVFFNFVDKLIGTDYRKGQLAKIVKGEGEIPTATMIPQLGSTAAVAGGIMAEVVARIRLGHKYPPRLIFDKNTFETKIYS